MFLYDTKHTLIIDHFEYNSLMAITREQLDQYTLRLSGLHEKLGTEELYQKSLDKK